MEGAHPPLRVRPWRYLDLLADDVRPPRRPLRARACLNWPNDQCRSR